VRRGSLIKIRARLSLVRLGTVRPCTVRLGAVRPGIARLGTVRLRTARRDARADEMCK
jgi:hypothetical protein